MVIYIVLLFQFHWFKTKRCGLFDQRYLREGRGEKGGGRRGEEVIRRGEGEQLCWEASDQASCVQTAVELL